MNNACTSASDVALLRLAFPSPPICDAGGPSSFATPGELGMRFAVCGVLCSFHTCCVTRVCGCHLLVPQFCTEPHFCAGCASLTSHFSAHGNIRLLVQLVHSRCSQQPSLTVTLCFRACHWAVQPSYGTCQMLTQPSCQAIIKYPIYVPAGKTQPQLEAQVSDCRWKLCFAANTVAYLWAILVVQPLVIAFLRKELLRCGSRLYLHANSALERIDQLLNAFLALVALRLARSRRASMR